MANTNLILPYPFQLPQDMYAKGLPQPTPTPPPTPPEQPIYILPPIEEPVTVNNGGVYYGPSPPASAQFGWLWSTGKGAMYVYIEPGIWSQVSTNW